MFALFSSILESRLFMPIAVLILLSGLYATAFIKGNNHCVARYQQLSQKEIKKHDKIETNVSHLDHDALFKRLRKFQRD
jgi:hypothetical protein